jgi:hypothetical protein
LFTEVVLTASGQDKARRTSKSEELEKYEDCRQAHQRDCRLQPAESAHQLTHETDDLLLDETVKSTPDKSADYPQRRPPTGNRKRESEEREREARRC